MILGHRPLAAKVGKGVCVRVCEDTQLVGGQERRRAGPAFSGLGLHLCSSCPHRGAGLAGAGHATTLCCQGTAGQGGHGGHGDGAGQAEQVGVSQATYGHLLIKQPSGGVD